MCPVCPVGCTQDWDAYAPYDRGWLRNAWAFARADREPPPGDTTTDTESNGPDDGRGEWSGV